MMRVTRVVSVLLLLVVGLVAALNNGEQHLGYCEVAIIGAGPGGIYTAWRLATAGHIRPSSICVFEQENRIGGRIHTLNSLPGVPELDGFVIDIGARRFNPVAEYMTSSLIRHLSIPTDCVPESPPCISRLPSYFLRNANISYENLGNSDFWPYNVLPSERWGPGKPNPTQPSFLDPLFVVYPFLADYLGNLTSPDPAIKWRAVGEVLKRVKDYPVSLAGNLLAGNLNTKIAFGALFSSELWQSLIDSSGGISYALAANFYGILRELTIGIAATGSDYFRPLQGYIEWVEEMASEFTRKGGKLFLNQKLEEIDDAALGLTRLKFESGRTEFAPTVVLNMPPHLVKLLGGSQNPYRSPASADALVALDTIFNVHSTKMAIYYSDAWWASKLGITDGGTLVTNEIISNVFYGPVKCSRGNRCSGWMVFYVVGDENSQYFRQPSSDQSETLTVLTPDNDGRALLSYSHSLLLKVHANLLNDHNISASSIAPPSKAIAANYNVQTLGGWHTVQPSPLDPSYLLHLFQQPAKNSHVYLVNEAYSPRHGWAEGSLIMAEKFLRNRYNMARPDWLDPTWYDVWVTQDL